MESKSTASPTTPKKPRTRAQTRNTETACHVKPIALTHPYVVVAPTDVPRGRGRRGVGSRGGRQSVPAGAARGAQNSTGTTTTRRATAGRSRGANQPVRGRAASATRAQSQSKKTAEPKRPRGTRGSSRRPRNTTVGPDNATTRRSRRNTCCVDSSSSCSEESDSTSSTCCSDSSCCDCS